MLKGSKACFKAVRLPCLSVSFKMSLLIFSKECKQTMKNVKTCYKPMEFLKSIYDLEGVAINIFSQFHNNKISEHV